MSAASRDGLIGPLRSRRGCKTCKTRRVKCGQEKPHCLRCTSTGRKCEYDRVASGTFSSSSFTLSLLHNHTPFSTNSVWRERRAFAYYFEHAALLIGGELDVDFWRVFIPQVCRSEPAVWDAVISISALFECPQSQQDGSLARNHFRQDALAWYSRSVSAIRQRIQSGDIDIIVGLISCALFICIEAIHGGVENALRLYSQGVHLIRTLRTQIYSGAIPETTTSLLENTIVPIYVRLGSLAFPISRVDVLLEQPAFEPVHALEGFASLKAARDAIMLFGVEVQLLDHACAEHFQITSAYHVPQELLDQQMNLAGRLRSWHAAFKRLMELPHVNDISTTSVLLVYYETLYITVMISVSPLETAGDAYLANFHNLVQQAAIFLDASARLDGTQLPFTFDSSVGFPLFFTCLRCREPGIRRTALALLLRGPQIQGFYKCDTGAKFGSMIMMLEEKRVMQRSSTVPEIIDSSTLEITGSQTDSGLDANLYPVNTPMEAVPLSDFIPEEARLGPVSVFFVKDGFPPGTPQEVIDKWANKPNQPFFRFSRNQWDHVNGAWRMVRGVIPLMFPTEGYIT